MKDQPFLSHFSSSSPKLISLFSPFSYFVQTSIPSFFQQFLTHFLYAIRDSCLASRGDDCSFENLQQNLEVNKISLVKSEIQGCGNFQSTIKKISVDVLLMAGVQEKARMLQDQTSTASESENNVVFTEMQEFVWSLQIEEAQKVDSEDLSIHGDEGANIAIEGKNFEAGIRIEVKETNEDKKPDSKDQEEVVPDETIREVAVGKGLSGALKLLKDQGSLEETVEWGGRKMYKMGGLFDDDESKDAHNTKEIRIERTDEFGRILTPKEAFRLHSHKFHGKKPGKRKQEKSMKRYSEELKMKQMNSSGTLPLSMERMRESQARLKTPYLVLSSHVKPGQSGDPKSGFSTVENSSGGLSTDLGDRKVKKFLRIKRKAEPSNSNAPTKPKS